MNGMNDQNEKRDRGQGGAGAVCRQEATPCCRVDETQEAFLVAIELPGVDGRAAELAIEDRTLSVVAENAPGRYEGHELVLNEIPAVRYRASFSLPECVDTAGIRAALRQGVLELTLPKRGEASPRRIAITAE